MYKNISTITALAAAAILALMVTPAKAQVFIDTPNGTTATTASTPAPAPATASTPAPAPTPASTPTPTPPSGGTLNVVVSGHVDVSGTVRIVHSGTVQHVYSGGGSGSSGYRRHRHHRYGGSTSSSGKMNGKLDKILAGQQKLQKGQDSLATRIARLESGSLLPGWVIWAFVILAALILWVIIRQHRLEGIIGKIQNALSSWRPAPAGGPYAP